MNWHSNLLTWVYSLLLLSAFTISAGWTIAGFDEKPTVGRSKVMQTANEPLKTTTLVLSSVAELISVLYLISCIIVVQSKHNETFNASKVFDILIPIIFIAAATISIVNVSIDNREKRGDALGISTIVLNSLAGLLVIYSLVAHVYGHIH